MTDETSPSAEASFLAAVRTGDLGAVESLLAARPTLAAARDGGASAVLIARYHGKLPVVAALRARIPEPDTFVAAALGDRSRSAPRARRRRDDA